MTRKHPGYRGVWSRGEIERLWGASPQGWSADLAMGCVRLQGVITLLNQVSSAVNRSLVVARTQVVEYTAVHEPCAHTKF